MSKRKSILLALLVITTTADSVLAGELPSIDPSNEQSEFMQSIASSPDIQRERSMRLIGLKNLHVEAEAMGRMSGTGIDRHQLIADLKNDAVKKLEGLGITVVPHSAKCATHMRTLGIWFPRPDGRLKCTATVQLWEQCKFSRNPSLEFDVMIWQKSQDTIIDREEMLPNLVMQLLDAFAADWAVANRAADNR